MQGRKALIQSHHDAVLGELLPRSTGIFQSRTFDFTEQLSLSRLFPSPHRGDARRDVQHRQHPVRPTELQGAAAAAPERPGGAVRRPHGLYLHRLQRTVLVHLRAFSPRDSVSERDQDRI